MGSIQCQIFQRTVSFSSLANFGNELTNAWNVLRAELNAFLATIPAQDVCEINEHIAQFGIESRAAHLTIHVYFFSP